VQVAFETTAPGQPALMPKITKMHETGLDGPASGIHRGSRNGRQADDSTYLERTRQKCFRISLR
jgi:hypothetical protein